MPQIKVEDLKKVYKTHKRESGFLNAVKSFFKREYVTKEAVKGVNFSIQEGERVAIIGPNGAGKSTTVKMLTGILKPTSGKAEVLNRDPFKKRNELTEKYGVIFGQKNNLWWDIPPVDTFYLYRELYDVPREVFEERLELIKKSLGLKGFFHNPVRKLSLGERMRCELGLLFIHNPEILFLDEPTIGVDVVGKSRIKNFLLRINEEYNTTIILTSHDMRDVEEICDRVIIINEGEILFDGRISKLKEEFVDSKSLKLTFEEPLNQKTLYDKELDEVEPGVYKIMFNADENVNRFLKKVLSSERKEVVDIQIIEEDLHEIIKNIFEANQS